ncbi:hypothetical protein [Sphingomonas aerolata]|uniref:hypothetical protein n=1 Tax=Sphingomonas aerolata TaxID=185951 RepID=UPI00335DC82A
MVALVMRPRWHNDHELLAAVAVKIHADNATRYRALFAEKAITRAAAIEAVRVTFTVACSWRAIAALAPAGEWIDDPDLGGAWPYERRQMLSDAAEVARRAADAMPNCFETVGFADAVDTLVWWETASPPARLIADTNMQCRREAAMRPPARPRERRTPPTRPAPIAAPPIANPPAPRAVQTTLFGVAA